MLYMTSNSKGQRLLDRVAMPPLSRGDTSLLKGVAILLMLFHHSLGGTEVGIQGYDAVIPDITRWLSSYGKACVVIFAFVSGYGLCCSSSKEKVGNVFLAGWNHLKRFYLFFVAFSIFLAGMAWLFPRPGFSVHLLSFGELLGRVSGLYKPFTDFWYIGAFIVFTLFCYPILLACRRRSSALLAFAMTALAVGSVATAHSIIQGIAEYAGIAGSGEFALYRSLEELTFMQGRFLIPYFIYGWAWGEISRGGHVGKFWCVAGVVLLLTFMRQGFPGSILGVFIIHLAVALRPALERVPAIIKSLCFLGQYSSYMWLNHRVMFGVWAASFFFAIPTPLNFLLLVPVSLGAAWVTARCWEALEKVWRESPLTSPANTKSSA